MADISKQKLEIYNYNIKSFDILYSSGKITSVKPEMIYKFSIVKNFDSMMFPIFNLAFHINVNDYYEVIKNKKTVKFRFSLRKSKMDKNEPSKVNVPETKVFDEIFTSYISESTPFFDENLYKISKDVRGGAKGTTPEDMATMLELYLFKEKDIVGTGTLVNKVLGNLTLTDAIFDLYKTCGLGDNLLMQKLQNQEVYSEIVIPPLPMLGALQHLENFYQNFYYGASTIFFDYDTKYVMKKQLGCAIWRVQEYKQTVILVRESKDSQKNQVSTEKNKKDKKYYISVSPDLVSINKDSIVNDVVDATDIVLVDTKTGWLNNVNTTVDRRGAGNKKVVFQSKYNNRMCEEIRTKITNKATTITVSCSNIDTEAISPNKEFVIKFLDNNSSQELSGSYRLSSVSYDFKSNGSSGFNLGCFLKFTK